MLPAREVACSCTVAYGERPRGSAETARAVGRPDGLSRREAAASGAGIAGVVRTKATLMPTATPARSPARRPSRAGEVAPLVEHGARRASTVAAGDDGYEIGEEHPSVHESDAIFEAREALELGALELVIGRNDLAADLPATGCSPRRPCPTSTATASSTPRPTPRPTPPSTTTCSP